MSDPAKEAADRVMEADWEESPDVWVTVAREALTPVRELHPREYVGCGDTEEWLCPECMVTWPCNTAKIIYTTEELTDDA